MHGVAVGNAQMHKATVQTINTHRLRPPIDRRFHFEDAKDAYRPKHHQISSVKSSSSWRNVLFVKEKMLTQRGVT